MKDIPRWSVVFLFLLRLSFDIEMQRMLKIPQDCHTIKGMWRFEDKTKGKCEEDLVYGGHIVGAMEVLGDLGILLNYPSGSTLVANISVGQKKLPRVFSDS